MGGSGVHTTPNMNNFKESDEDMQGKIQRIEVVKYNPQMFHREINAENAFNIVGGAPACACSLIGGLFSYGYYLAQPRAYNQYTHILRSQMRFGLGALVGCAFGYVKFGDRQQLHNAFTAERLRARYPESMSLNMTDLWRFKGVKAPHEFYRWA